MSQRCRRLVHVDVALQRSWPAKRVTHLNEVLMIKIIRAGQVSREKHDQDDSRSRHGSRVKQNRRKIPRSDDTYWFGCIRWKAICSQGRSQLRGQAVHHYLRFLPSARNGASGGAKPFPPQQITRPGWLQCLERRSMSSAERIASSRKRPGSSQTTSSSAPCQDCVPRNRSKWTSDKETFVKSQSYHACPAINLSSIPGVA